MNSTDMENSLKNTLDVLNNVQNIENLTPDQAAEILRLFQQTSHIDGIRNVNKYKALK